MTSLGKKGKATKHLEAVGYHHTHIESSKRKQYTPTAMCIVEVHVKIGPLGLLFDTRLYLREKTMRHLNQQRPVEKRLHFRTKYALARQILVELEQLLPKGHKIYVLFDSWYASKKLITFCPRQQWHVICALKPNWRIDKVCIDQYNLTLKHRPYRRNQAGGYGRTAQSPHLLHPSRQRHLEDIAAPVHVIISKKRLGDKRPKYFACTDLILSIQQVLRIYQMRWVVEVNNLNLKQALGLGDFRLQSFEAVQKWFAVVMLMINYLQYRMRWLTAKI